MKIPAGITLVLGVCAYGEIMLKIMVLVQSSKLSSVKMGDHLGTLAKQSHNLPNKLAMDTVLIIIFPVDLSMR